jgi:hypothetical protein
MWLLVGPWDASLVRCDLVVWGVEPPASVTNTLNLPGTPGGVVAMISVGETTWTLAACTGGRLRPCPICTVSGPLKNPVPVIVIWVPPDLGPLLGLTDEMVGGGS